MRDASIGRRTFLAASAAAAGLVVARGLGVHGPLGRAPAAHFDEALRDFAASLSPAQRARILLPADHPSRQITNTIAFLDRPHLGTLLSPSQLAAAADLCDRMLSAKGRHDLAGTFAVEGKFEGCVLTIYGDPQQGPAQLALLGGHVHLRGGDRGGVPLGGGVAYGHQIGNEEWRIPGNSFAHHGDAANAVYTALDEAERARATERKAPIELVVQPQGETGRFDGLRIGDANEGARAAAATLLATVLSTYPEAEAAEALSAIDARGGVDALHLAFYESHGFHADMIPVSELDAAARAQRGTPYWQVWRLEGPGTVIHFQGHPHVHAYVQITGEGDAWQHGEPIGHVDRTIEGAELRDVLEAALRQATGEALAFHAEQVFGRICKGTVTSGLAWSLDPFGNRVAVAEIAAADMATPLRERLAATSGAIEDGARVRIATSDYFAGREDVFGRASRVDASSLRLGEAFAAHLRTSRLIA